MSRACLFPLSGANVDALVALARSHLRALGARDCCLEVEDVCYTAGVGRDHRRYRAAVVGASREELLSSLCALVADRDSVTPCLSAPSLAFMFPGTAALVSGTLLELLGAELCFLETMQRCDEALEALAVEPLLAQVLDGDERASAGSSRRAAGAFAVELSLAELWRGWGLEPVAAGGCGPGRHAAAVFTGSVSLKDGLAAVLADPDATEGAGPPHDLDVVLDIALPECGVGRLRERLLVVLGEFYARGFEPCWESLVGAGARRVSLPKYPWQRQPLAPEFAGRVPLAYLTPGEEHAPVAESPQERELAHDSFIALVARIFRLPIERMMPSQTLSAHGLDSLMAMEIATAAEVELCVQLSLERIAGDATLSELAEEAAALAGSALAERRPVAVLEVDEAGRFEPFPLSEIQRAYWVGRHSGLELGGVSTHVYIELEGPPLDCERMRTAIDRLVARHDMLRAVIGADGRQRVLPTAPSYELAVVELGGLDATARERVLRRTRRELSHQVRPSERWPLFEIRISRLDTVDRLHLSFDMLIADAVSLLLLARELALFYADPNAVLPELGLRFRDYVQAERRLAGSGEHEGAWTYWRSRIPRLPPPPELPLARAPSELGTPHFRRLDGRLEPSAWGALKARANNAGLTPSALVCAAYAEVLGRFARRSRFTLNVTNSHRLALHPDVNAIVGDFTSLSLLEVDTKALGGFEERARALQVQLWHDLQHRAVNGVSVLRQFPPTRGHSAVAMPIVFTSVLNHTVGVEAFPLDAFGREVYAISQTPQVHLDHQVMERDGALVFSWDVVEGLFAEELVEDMFAAFDGLVRRLAIDAESWSDRAPLELPTAQRQRRARVNATAAPVPDVLLHEPFLARAAADPGHPAVICGDRRLSYGELARLVRSLGAELRRRGARPNALVAIAVAKGVEQVAAALAVVEAGAAYLPLDLDLPRKRLNWLLEHGDVELVITQSDIVAQLDWPAGVELVCIDRHEIAETPSLRRSTPEDLAYVIFTSGSTGLPKGVMVEHRAALNTVIDINRRFALTSADRVLALSALAFDLSVWDLFGALAAGATIVMPESGRLRDPAHWAELVAGGVSVWNSVPALMKLFVEHLEHRGEPMPGQLRLALLSGDWIPVALPARLRAVADGVEIVSLGGATEAAIWSIYHRIDAGDAGWDSIPYGRPLANQTFRVLDEALDDRPDWVAGELYIGGVGLARGYWKDPERTAAAFATHPRSGERLYRTGDIGRYRPCGEIEFLGREDRQIKLHGYRIELGEVEAALEAHPEIGEALARVLGEAHAERRLVVHYVPAKGADPDPAELRSFMAARLPVYMLPAALSPIEGVPLTPNGKVDRKALPDSTRSARHAEVDGPVAAAMCELLGLEWLDPESDLLAQGVSSLDVVRLADGLERRLGVRPRLELLFRAQTAAALVQELDALGDHGRRRHAETCG